MKLFQISQIKKQYNNYPSWHIIKTEFSHMAVSYLLTKSLQN